MIKYQLLLHILTDATSVLMWLLLPLACHTATAQGNPYAMIGEVSRVEYAMPFERMPRLVNAGTTGDTAAMLIDGYGGKILFVDASESILGTAELPDDAVLMWLSVDPMLDKYPGVSPYAYCLWNPIRLVDPDGRDVYISGTSESKEEALRQIQQKSKCLKFSIDGEGKLTCEGLAKTRRDRYMSSIIENENIHVLLQVQNHSDCRGGTIDIGGFGGNVISDDKSSVTAFQCINVVGAKAQDLICNNAGNMIWHEISETYEGGLISLQTGENAPSAVKGNELMIFNRAHLNAGTYFPGTIRNGTIKEYIGMLPKGLQAIIPDVYMKLQGNKQVTWYSRQ